MSAPPTPFDGQDQSWMDSSTCRAVDALGHQLGREYGLAESTSRALAWLLGRQARTRFGGPDEAGKATLDGLARAFATEQLQELAERLLDATSWNEWLTGVVVPPPAPGLPDYTSGLEIDLEPSGPSIDSYAEVSAPGHGRSIVHMRLQKAYQPDLDRLLYEASRKIERKWGKMPMVGVCLMRPCVEGPGMTGRFEERDAAGKVTHVFTYSIRKAWESTPEEVTQTTGTLLLAPLTMGARERMPEVVQMVKQCLERHSLDDKQRAGIWTAVYWSMGFVCDLDEAHRALGDVLHVIESSHLYQNAKGQAFLHAYSAAQHEGRSQAGRTLVVRQAARRFGPDASAAAAIAALSEPEELRKLTQRVLTATSWESLLGES